MGTRYVQSNEGRGRVEVEVSGCTCEDGPLIVNIKADDHTHSYCARCENTISKRYYGKAGGVLIPFGARVEQDRPWGPRDPNEQY